MVIAAEADDSIECDVCKVTHVTDAAVTLHCWGTQGKNPKTATYKPVFIDKHGNVLLHKPRKSDRAEPFTWEIRTEDISTLLKVRGARVLKNGRLSKQSIDALKQADPRFTIHRY